MAERPSVEEFDECVRLLASRAYDSGFTGASSLVCEHVNGDASRLDARHQAFERESQVAQGKLMAMFRAALESK